MPQFIRKNLHSPVDILIGCCVTLVAAAGGAVLHVASLALAILFILSLFYIRDWYATWCSLQRVEKLVCLGFIVYTLSGFLSWINVADQVDFIKQAGRYLRFTFIIPVYLMIRYRGLNLTPYFIVGVVLSGFIYFGYAVHGTRLGQVASGQYHHITYSNAIMLNVGLLGLLLMTKRIKTIYSVTIGIAVLLGLVAVILAESRASWVLLPVYLIFYAVYARYNKDVTMKRLLLIGVVVLAILPFTSAIDIVKERYAVAITDLKLFDQEEDYNTSLGTRFSLWYIAFEVWQEHPLIGTGLGDFDEDMARYQAQGVYPGVIINKSTHNIYFQALAGTGLIGLLVMCYALLFAPIRLFAQYRIAPGGGFVLMGYMLIISYAIFGLSESWMLRSPVIAIFLIYLISIASILHVLRVKHSNDDHLIK